MSEEWTETRPPAPVVMYLFDSSRSIVRFWQQRDMNIREKTQCLLEPWELFGTVLRDHVLMKLTRTLEIVMSSAQWTRGVHSTTRIISGSRWRSELGDARRSIDKDHREILICSIDCHALAVVSVVHDPVILYLVGKWVRETERDRERERVTNLRLCWTDRRPQIHCIHIRDFPRLRTCDAKCVFPNARISVLRTTYQSTLISL